MSKKIIAVLLMLALLIPLVACNGGTGEGSGGEGTDEGGTKVFTSWSNDITSEEMPAAAEVEPLLATETEINDSAEALIDTAEVWVKNEITLISSTEYKKPLRECTLDLILTNGDTTLTVPGFWDGKLV